MHKRFHELDALRGLAALVVVFIHIFILLDYPSKFIYYSPLRLLISGHAAVILFFLISGFVLSLPYHAGNQKTYARFIIARICRIWIPCIVAVIIAIVGKQLLYHPRPVNTWIDETWRYSIETADLINYFFMIGDFTPRLDGPLWSLIHEMRISLIFPFLITIYSTLSFRQGLLLAIGISLLALILSLRLKSDFLLTLHYTSIFAIGALLAKYPFELRRRKFLLVVAALLVTYGTFLNFVPYGIAGDLGMDWPLTVGGSLFLLLALQEPSFNRFLKRSPVQFLGKISYSLYLLHMIVILSLVYGTDLPVKWIAALVLPVSIALATIMYYLVEKPSMQLGKWLTRHKDRATSYLPSNMSKSSKVG